MASFNRRDPDPKASSLADRSVVPDTAVPSSVETEAGARRSESKRSVPKRSGNLLVDLILLLVIVGLIAGGVWAFRTVSEIYAPTWETRDVIFCVEITDVDPAMVKYGQDGRPTMVGHPLWSSDRTDADQLGTVTSIRTILISGEDGENSLTLYLKVEAQPHYRMGKGYRMGGTMLLAGLEGRFLAQGLVAEGRIISMHEKETSTTQEGGTVMAEPQGFAPIDEDLDVQG